MEGEVHCWWVGRSLSAVGAHHLLGLLLLLSCPLRLVIYSWGTIVVVVIVVVLVVVLVVVVVMLATVSVVLVVVVSWSSAGGHCGCAHILALALIVWCW